MADYNPKHMESLLIEATDRIVASNLVLAAAMLAGQDASTDKLGAAAGACHEVFVEALEHVRR